jgi:hypothetical protein
MRRLTDATHATTKVFQLLFRGIGFAVVLARKQFER